MDDCHFGSVTKFLKQTLMSMQLLADCQIQKGTKTCKKAEESYPASSISRDDIIPALNKQNKKMVSVCGECKNLQGSSVWTWWHQIALEIYKQDRSWQLMTDKNTQSMKLRQAFEIDLQYLL
jgi:phage gp16-like protein